MRRLRQYIRDKQVAGVLVAAIGVGAAFVVAIGTGFRVTRTPNSPIADPLYFASIGVLAVALAMGARRMLRGVSGSLGDRATTRAHLQFLEEEQRRADEEQRRRQDYAVTPDQLATCEHLQPIERAMRASGLGVQLRTGSTVSAHCRVHVASLRDRFPSSVAYAEPEPVAISFAYPLPAMIGCSACHSAIEVVHPADATSETPVFPLTSEVRAPDHAMPTSASVARFIHLRARILELARIIDAPEPEIPTYRQSMGNGLAHVEIDDQLYHYVHQERGSEFERFSTSDVDELLYRIFRDVAFSMSTTLARPHRKPGEDFRRAMFPQQLGLLRRLNAEWAVRCAAEHEDVLRQYPFVDE